MSNAPTIGVDDRELDDLALEALAEAHATPPPPGLREQVLAGARRTGDVRALRRWRRVAVGAAAAGVLLAWFHMQTTTRAAEEVAAATRASSQLLGRFEAQNRALAGLREALAIQAAVLRVLGGPRMLSAALAPQPGVSAIGRVIVDAASGETAVIISGLEPAVPGKTYELWAIRGEAPPEPAGVFTLGPELWATVPAKRIERPEEVTALAVSIEPAGGSKTPTGPILLVGRVSG
jgi:hypothetical protein